MVERYGISVSQMTMGMFHLSLALPDPCGVLVTRS